ncbi:MAG: WYL domain-containing protein [Actinobacteria bacterium]|nr:WYL domain-containing protein [Actinomycetota bacterium]
MAKNPQTPLSRTSRLLDLVPYLTSHQGIDLNILAQDFSVSSSQMVADLTTLWMCGLPGYTPLELMDLSFDSGYVTIHNADTLASPRNLTIEEAIALLLGLDLVVQSMPPDRNDLKEIAQGLIDRLSLLANLPSRTRVDSNVNELIRTMITSAISKKQAVKIQYHSLYSDEVSKRTIHPLEFRVDGTHEYLWAYCEKAAGFRSFRVDRILESSISGPRTESFQSSNSTVANSITYSLQVFSRFRDVAERFSLDEMEKGSQSPGTSYSSQWLLRAVMASAGAVELTSPQEIRSHIAATASGLLDRYKAG